ncbi:MAG: hypothetical protein JSR66_31480 [Proteobacteria bacterium]|nr:hypothetical protein [Pseudomonadota bacterium]
MSAPLDIVVDSPIGRRILFVECKATRSSTPRDAANVRRKLIMYTQLPLDAFFLLAVPSKLFLWGRDAALDAVPAFTANAQPVLRDYLGALADQEGGPRGESLGLAIAGWLGDLTSNLRSPDKTDADRMLVDSGLLEKIKGGRVRTDQTL